MLCISGCEKSKIKTKNQAFVFQIFYSVLSFLKENFRDHQIDMTAPLLLHDVLACRSSFSDVLVFDDLLS